MELASDEMAEAPIVVQPVSLEDFVQRRPPKLLFPLEQTSFLGNQAESTACVREAICCCKMRHLKGLDLGPSGVNCLRARDEGQLQDAPREGLESTVSEPQSLHSLVVVMAVQATSSRAQMMK